MITLILLGALAFILFRVSVIGCWQTARGLMWTIVAIRENQLQSRRRFPTNQQDVQGAVVGTSWHGALI